MIRGSANSKYNRELIIKETSIQRYLGEKRLIDVIDKILQKAMQKIDAIL